MAEVSYEDEATSARQAGRGSRTQAAKKKKPGVQIRKSESHLLKAIQLSPVTVLHSIFCSGLELVEPQDEALGALPRMVRFT